MWHYRSWITRPKETVLKIVNWFFFFWSTFLEERLSYLSFLFGGGGGGLVAKLGLNSCERMTVASRLLCPWDSSGKSIGVDCHFLLQGIFPTLGLNPHLLLGRWILYHWTTWQALSKHTRKLINDIALHFWILWLVPAFKKAIVFYLVFF